MARAYVGTSGWMYPGWRAHLYADEPVKRWLHVASRTFDALEISGSFYTQIAPATYARWYAETPPRFRFALKGHRFVMHYKRLRDCEDSIVRLRDQAAPLGDKLAAVVWQLPSRFERDLPRLEAFAAALAELWPRARHAIELRHRSWFVDDVARVLADARIASCLSDAPDFPLWRQLRAWAADARRWLREGRDVHVYFDNDAEGHAVANARRFGELVTFRRRGLSRLP